jgi:hypothetical protein
MRVFPLLIAVAAVACASGSGTANTPGAPAAPASNETKPAAPPAAASKPAGSAASSSAAAAKPSAATATASAPRTGAPRGNAPSPDRAPSAEPQAPQEPQTGDRPAGGGDGPQGGGRPQTPAEPRPYDRVITKDAVTDEGLFKVHRIKEKYYYEIPPAMLGKELLWVSQIAKTSLGVGYGGQALGNRVVRFERRDNRVLLRGVNYDMIADPKLPIALAVDAANTSPILMAFNIEAFAKDESPVIEVTRLFTTEVAEISARPRLRARGFDASRSFVDRIVSFPTNIEVEATHTYTIPAEAPGGAPQAPGNPFAPQGMRGNSGTVVLHYSMVKLPEQPMQPRLFDERVGYFSVSMQDFSRGEHRVPERRYITRWRLDKKDPNAAISEPVKPITYYVDPGTPGWLVPYVKKGIEKWQVAFEEAGFKNAIVAKEAPTKQQDPDWSPEDARYSVVRWLPSTTENAVGPHVHDPRTGEILESDIQMYHNVMNLQRAWYFTQAGALDPRAKKLPFPDDLMGELVEYVVAHEVGHTLGFQHNMKGSSTYPFEKLRDKEWLRTMGHTPSIMDYSRFNYVAQPEDNIPVKDLVPGIGPYDKWATMWGYKPITTAKSSDDEKKTLSEWARAQDKTPWLRFSTDGTQGSDPGELTEAVGDGDAVKATTLGYKNLARVSDMLLPAATFQDDPWDDLTELYGRLVGQWATEGNHVTAIVGGFTSQQVHGGQGGVRFTPVPRARQAEAVKFLNDSVFATPAFLIKPEILRRIEPQGAVDRINAAQRRVLTSVLGTTRINRMVEQEALDGASAYKATEMLADVRHGVWRELGTPSVSIDPYRRALQRSYLQLFDERLNGRTAVGGDVRAFFRGELQSLGTQLAAAQAKAKPGDAATRMHIADSQRQVQRILDPRFAPVEAAAAAGGQGGRGGLDEELAEWLSGMVSSCWPDIR